LKLKTENEPTGLKNVGNTCYFNSILQVLFSFKNISLMILQTEIPALKPSPSGADLEPKQVRERISK
jgi:ubiquitin C-terminal hydrolase